MDTRFRSIELVEGNMNKSEEDISLPSKLLIRFIITFYDQEYMKEYHSLVQI